MVVDEVYKKSDTKEIVEILIDNIWIPAMGVDLRVMNRDYELVRVAAVRTRKFTDEELKTDE